MTDDSCQTDFDESFERELQKKYFAVVALCDACSTTGEDPEPKAKSRRDRSKVTSSTVNLYLPEKPVSQASKPLTRPEKIDWATLPPKLSPLQRVYFHPSELSGMNLDSILSLEVAAHKRLKKKK